MNKLFSDTKVEIKSDNIYLPKITANGVPIYDSLRASKLVIVFRNFEVLAPLLIGLHIHNPGTMLIASAATYLLLYRVKRLLCLAQFRKILVRFRTQNGIGPLNLVNNIPKSWVAWMRKNFKDKNWWSIVLLTKQPEPNSLQVNTILGG